MAGKWHVSREDFPRGLLQRTDDPADPTVNEALIRHQVLARERVKRDGGFDEARSVMFGNYDGFPVASLKLHNYPWVNKGALDFIEESARGDKPFFLYLAATSLHGPHHAEGLVRDYGFTPEGRMEGLEAYNLDVEALAAQIGTMTSPESHRFAGMAFLDHQVGLVVDKLKELGIEDNTVLVFLPDHNTEPGKSTCYEKGVKIPMFIRWPARIEPGTRTGAMVQSIDLLPTLLEIAGVKMPEGYEVDGRSLLPVLEDPGKELREYIYSESGYTRAIFDGKYKYIAFRYPEEMVARMKDGTLSMAPTHVASPGGIPIVNMSFYPGYWDSDQLYDLESDPFEQENLAGNPGYAETVQELQAVLKEYLEGFEHPFDLSPQEFMQSELFLGLARKTSRQKPEDIVWYVRDWGRIVWPPDHNHGM
jgi:arylsulfatase A-like enzyme